MNVLLLWIASNTFMVATVLCVPALSTFKPTKDGGKGFLWVGIVTWSNAILLAVQYVGMVLYYITRSIDRWIWTKRKSRFGRPDLEKTSK
jgi:nitric oxide reductase large subunit